MGPASLPHAHGVPALVDGSRIVHRADKVQFLKSIKSAIFDPTRLMLDP